MKLDKKKKIIITTISIIVGILLVIGTVGSFYVNSLLNKVNYEKPGEETDNPNYTPGPNDIIDPSSLFQDPKVTPPANLPGDQPVPIWLNDKDIVNILLIGVDRRDSSWNGNSDTTIILTIDKKKKEVKLTSIMRDSYVYVPGKGYSKINYAYAVKGPNFLMETIKHNFGIQIDNYVCVDFNAFKSIVDILGGVKMPLSADEIEIFKNNAKFAGGAGTYLLNSSEALAYARNRKIGRWDFDRTKRQRKMLSVLFDQVKSEDIFTLNKLLGEALPYVKTNFTKNELMSFILMANSFRGAKVQEFRMPIDGSYQTSVERDYIMVMDMSANIAALQKFILGE